MDCGLTSVVTKMGQILILAQMPDLHLVTDNPPLLEHPHPHRPRPFSPSPTARLQLHRFPGARARHPTMGVLTAAELNYLVFRYLQESGACAFPSPFLARASWLLCLSREDFPHFCADLGLGASLLRAAGYPGRTMADLCAA
jgi:hypothetical protein